MYCRNFHHLLDIYGKLVKIQMGKWAFMMLLFDDNKIKMARKSGEDTEGKEEKEI